MAIEKKKLKIIELCSGIGCQLRGIQNTPCFEPEVVATSEINKEAVLAYAAIHCGLTNKIIVSFSDYPPLEAMKQELSDLNLGYIPEKDKKFDWFKGGKTHNENVKKYWLACKLSKNMGDVSRIEQLPEADVWFLSYPCTDISCAGKLKGLNPDDKTRSSLIWQTLRLLKKAQETSTLPKYMILENVKNLVGKKFINDFNTFNQLISEYNYNCYWKVLNAKDCGVPQNRERVFAIYIRKDIDTGNYEFPIPFDNGLRLKDVLEDEVDEKYYINTEKAQALIQRLLDEGIIGEDNLDRQGSTYQLSSQDQSILRTASPQEQTEGLATGKQKIPVYANYNKVDGVDVETARTVLARDYKGFGTSNETSNAVVEKS